MLSIGTKHRSVRSLLRTAVLAQTRVSLQPVALQQMGDVAVPLRLRYFSSKRSKKALKDFEMDHEGFVMPEADEFDKLMRFKPLSTEEEKDSEDEVDKYEGRPEKDDLPEFLDNGDFDPKFKIGKALLSLGKIHYRHAEALPEWFLERQNEICQYRSNPQIRRCLKDWMIKHDRELLEKYRNKTLQWGHKAPLQQKPNDLKLYGPEETIAYANYFMPSRFGLMYRVFTELQRLAPEFVPKRTLDFGCGPATAAAAIHEVWGEDAHKYVGVDISQSMVDAARIMTKGKIRDATFYTSNSEVMKRAANTGERYDLAVAAFTLSELPTDPSKRIAVQMLFELLDVGGYLVIVEPGNPYGSHTTRTARQFVLDTFNSVDKSGRTPIDQIGSTFFLPGESGNSSGGAGGKGKKTGRGAVEEGETSDRDWATDSDGEEDSTAGRALAARLRGGAGSAAAGGGGGGGVDRGSKRERASRQVDMLLAPPKQGGFGYEQLGARVVAPCTHDGRCPMSKGTWCSFSQKVYSGVIRKSSEEKFSYVVLQKLPRPGQVPASQAKSSKGRGGAEESSSRDHGKWLQPAPLSTHSANPRSAPAAVEGEGEGGDPTPLAVLERFLGVKDDRQVKKLVDKLIDEVDWEEYEPPLHREEWGRIVRSPIKQKGHIVMDLCTPEGRLLRNTVARSNMPQIPTLYTALRKTTWGGLFPTLSGMTEQSAVTTLNKGSMFRGEAPAGLDPHLSGGAGDRYSRGRQAEGQLEEAGLLDSQYNMLASRTKKSGRTGAEVTSAQKSAPAATESAPASSTSKPTAAGKGLTSGRDGNNEDGSLSRGSVAVRKAEVVAAQGSDRYRRLMERRDRRAGLIPDEEGEPQPEPEEVEEVGEGRRGRGLRSALGSQLQRMRARKVAQDNEKDE